MLFLKPPPLLGRVAVGARGRRCAVLTDRKLTVNELVRVIEERVSSSNRFLNNFLRNHSCYIIVCRKYRYPIIFSRADYELNKTANLSNKYLASLKIYDCLKSKLYLAPTSNHHLKFNKF